MKKNGSATKIARPTQAVVHETEEMPHVRTPHTEGDEEPWLVSYADMMTLLFGFFVVMYSFASIKDDGKAMERMRKELSDHFGGEYATATVDSNDKVVPVVTSSSFTSDWEIGTAKDDKTGEADLHKKRGLKENNWADAQPRKELQIVTSTTQLFTATGLDLSPTGHTMVTRIAKDFQKNGTDSRLLVEVHANPASASKIRALRISAMQASAVLEALVKAGVSVESLIVGGYGTIAAQSTAAINAGQSNKIKEGAGLVLFRVQRLLPESPPPDPARR